ncbi:MAG: ABC transporter permease [Bacteriovoracaceae bacterium]
MMRYFKLYLHFLRFSFSKAMEFRVDFTFRILMDIIYYAVNLCFFKVIYLHTPLLAGWGEDQMLIFVSSFLLVDAISMTVFSSNMWWLPYFINRGDLDYYLIRPVSSLFFLSLRDFSANSFINLIMAFGIFFYNLSHLDQTFHWPDLLLLFILLLNGTLIHYCLQMIMILPVFWTHSARGFVDLFFALGIAMERPDRIYKGFLRFIFTCVLPFGLIASFPVKIFLEGLDWKIILHILGVSTALWGVMITIWKLGLRNYSSASS